MLVKIAENINGKYIVDGEWIMSKRTKKAYFDKAGKSNRTEDVFCNNVDCVRTEEVEYGIASSGPFFMRKARKEKRFAK